MNILFTSNVKVVQPKRLSEDETLTSFEDWRNNLEFLLQQEKDFNKLMKPDVAWKKTSEAVEHRGMTSDAEERILNQFFRRYSKLVTTLASRRHHKRLY